MFCLNPVMFCLNPVWFCLPQQICAQCVNDLAKDPLVASKTPTSEGVAEWLNDHVDANALRDEAYNIKKQINRKKVALIKARKKLEKALYAAECEEIFKEMDGHKDVLPKDPHPFDATYERTFGNGHTHVPGRKKRRQLKNLHHPGAIKVLMPVAAAALAVKKQEKKEYVIVSDSDDDDKGSRNMPKLLAPQARAAAARQAWLSEVDNIEHELDRINEQFESYKKQKHIGNTTVGTATATTTTAVAQPSAPVKIFAVMAGLSVPITCACELPRKRQPKSGQHDGLQGDQKLCKQKRHACKLHCFFLCYRLTQMHCFLALKESMQHFALIQSLFCCCLDYF
eukprot:g35362.t1